MLPPELSEINQKILALNQTRNNLDRNETIKSVFFIIYNSLRDLTTITEK